MPNMIEDDDIKLPGDMTAIVFVTLIAVALLSVVAIGSYVYAKKRVGTTVLPGGVTYLGPTTTPVAQPSPSTATIPIDSNTRWDTQKGKVFPYSFLYPSSLSLGFFPNDPFDGVTIFWKDTNSQENIFLRIEDLNKLKNTAQYIQTSKKEYVSNWWKQYTWKGVASVVEFTNANGMKGYRAKYIDDKGGTPFDNIFFEIPGKPDLVVWMGSKLLEQSVFDTMVNSFTWETSR